MFLGSVVLVLNWYQSIGAELYSPEGQCNFKLAAPPVISANPVLVFSNNRIIACSGGKSCWEYNSVTDAWLVLNQAPFKEQNQGGAVFKNKLYVTDSNNVHILDLKSNSWSKGPKPPKSFDNYPCTLGWKDSIILFGGDSYRKGVQIFNVTSQTWKDLTFEKVPMDMYWSSCLLIGVDKVLIVGSHAGAYPNSAAIYYPKNDSWVSLQKSTAGLWATRLVKLGSRIFALAGFEDYTVKEFFVANETWSVNPIKLLGFYPGHHSVVAVPASLFAHIPGGCKGVL